MFKSLLKRDNTKYTVKDIVVWMVRAWRGNHLQAILNATLGLVEVAISLCQVWAVKYAIDIASHNKEGSIYIAVGLMTLLIIGSFAVSISETWVQNILGVRAQNRMQQQMLDRILRSEWHNKEKMHSGDMINRLESDVSNVVNFLTTTIPNLLSTLCMFFSAFVYLYLMDNRLAVILVIVIPIFLLMSRIYIGKMRILNRKVRESDSMVQSILQETVQNRMLIKTLESDNEMIDKLEGTQSELRQRIVKRTAFSVTSKLIINTGFAFTYLLAFLWAALRLSANTLTYGGMAAFLQLVSKIQHPARQLTHLIPAAVSVFTAAERLMELEENPLEEQGDPIWIEGKCGIRLSDVSFRYPDSNEYVLNNINYDFEPGTCTAIIGHTGAGKTTVIRLILALLHPTKGKAEIYNDTKSIPLSARLRCNLVYVPQGNTLMSGSIRDNLRLGKLDATEEEMVDALKKSCSDFVFHLPDGIDTPCSEHGGGLSEGQAQRIAIARALLRNRNVMIFDEATSALDIETEKQLLSNILSSKDKTVIFITHRLEVVDYCDKVYRMQRSFELNE